MLMTPAILALLMPIALPVVALLLTRRFGLWWKASAIGFAVLASLPIGVALGVVAHQPDFFTSDYPSPAVGFVAIPVILLWFISAAGTTIWMIVVGVKKLSAHSQI
jgi:hypothetical protein